jgi:Tfp pilus assembly protein PilP
MKLTTGILAVAMMTGASWGQNPDAVDNTSSTTKSLPQIKASETNAVLAMAAGAPEAPQGAKPGSASPFSATGKPEVAHRSAASVPAARRRAMRAAGVMRREDAFAAKKQELGQAVGTTKIAAHDNSVAVGKIGEVAAMPSTTQAPKPEEKKWAMNGKRDPFFSPVVQQTSGSGCSSGKKCLEIGQINLRGVVKADSGFIAVVTNSLNKAYFLHENDPVFNGYVLKITGDSVVFQETVQDKLGKPVTQEVVKRISTPAV